MTAIDELLARNLAAAEYHPVGMGPMPTLKIALLMCMDARIDGHGAFRLNLGEVHLLRNAGGVVTDDVIRSLSISQHALGTREIMIIHHTDCGLATLEEDEFRAHLAHVRRLPADLVGAGVQGSARFGARIDAPHPGLTVPAHTDDRPRLHLRRETGLLEEVSDRRRGPTGRAAGAASGAGRPGRRTRLSTATGPRVTAGRPDADRWTSRSARPGSAVAGARRDAVGGAGQRGHAAADPGGPGAAGVSTSGCARWPRPADLAAEPPARRSGPGDGSATRAGRCGCTRRPPRSPPSTAATVPDVGRGAAGAARHRRVHRPGRRRVRVRRPDAGGRHQRAPGAVPGGAGRRRARAPPPLPTARRWQRCCRPIRDRGAGSRPP